MVGQAAPLGGNRGESEAPVRFRKRRQASSVPARSLISAVYNECSWEGEAPQKTTTNGFEFAALLLLHRLARLSPAPRCIRSAWTWCCDLAVCACGHDVQGVCWLFNGVITLADPADIESAGTTNTNFRIISPGFVRARPQINQALSYTCSLGIPGACALRRTSACAIKPFRRDVRYIAGNGRAALSRSIWAID
jgi:hypothetical protein